MYLSTKNINLPKGTSRKLAPKYVWPYCISEDFGNNSYRIEFPDALKQIGIHSVFHSSLLRIHVVNNDHLFPRRSEEQVPDLSGTGKEWAIEKVLTHRGSHSDTSFEVQWVSGDRSWVPYSDLEHLRPLQEYLEVIGVEGVENLRCTTEPLLDDDLQVSLGHIHLSPWSSAIKSRPSPSPHLLQPYPVLVNPRFPPVTINLRQFIDGLP